MKVSSGLCLLMVFPNKVYCMKRQRNLSSNIKRKWEINLKNKQIFKINHQMLWEKVEANRIRKNQLLGVYPKWKWKGKKAKREFEQYLN